MSAIPSTSINGLSFGVASENVLYWKYHHSNMEESYEPLFVGISIADGGKRWILKLDPISSLTGNLKAIESSKQDTLLKSKPPLRQVFGIDVFFFPFFF